MIPTIGEALVLFSQGTLTPSTLLERLLQRIQSWDEELHTYVSLDEAGARQAASEADEAWAKGHAGPLCGIPISIKDVVDVAQMVTGCGTSLFSEPAERDATLVRRLREAGAIILGKAHLHPFAFGLSGENPELGTPRNPAGAGSMPGGSSSGSAAGVAAELALASIGTDTGGSVRVPAAFCGVVGFKPSYGLISRAGVFPVAESMDHVGLLVRDVTDCRPLLDVLSGADERDPTSHILPPQYPLPGRVRLGLIGELHQGSDLSVRTCIENNLARRPGIEVKTVSLPGLKAARRAYGTIVQAEIAAVHQARWEENPNAYDGMGQGMIERGCATTAVMLLAAQQERTRFAREVEALWGDFDALVCPTVPMVAPPLGAEKVRINDREVSVAGALVRNTSPFSMIGVPALSLPAGGAQGLPVGLQLIAPYGQDIRLLTLAERMVLGLKLL
ncbi:MAG: amidase [Deltaproteobacteria bacterium]|nr:amidase [Deltaproteobacteria bacterium]